MNTNGFNTNGHNYANTYSLPAHIPRTQPMGPARWKDPPEDIKRRKLFVGGLPRGSNEEMLYSHFAKFGEIEDYILMR